MLNLCFLSQSESQSNLKMIHTKKPRTRTSRKPDLFDHLPDDLIVHILCKLSSSVSSPADLFNILLTCKRLNQLGIHPLVLSNVGPKAFSIKTENWSDSAHRFLKRCVDAGNSEASFILGMIRFYCLKNRGSGASLMAKAAIKSHAPALYSLAVIQFNGSGGSKTDKDLKAGVALCARAAFLGHVDALRELGHCLQDGYGVRQNTGEGRRLLLQANAREVASILRASTRKWRNENILIRDVAEAETERHPVNVFLREWFEKGRGRGRGSGSGSEEALRLCSHGGCGRVETRPHEFRRCSICGMVNYCSRGCQALHWKTRHKIECRPFGQWLAAAAAEDEDDGGGAGMEDVEEVEGNNVGTV